MSMEDSNINRNGLRPLVIGTVGSGFAARLHAEALKKVSGVPFRLKTVCDTDQRRAEELRGEYGYEQATASFEEMLKDPEIDLIDILTPPYLHFPFICHALRAGKHVICEKPLTGYFGQAGDPAPVGMRVPCGRMRRKIDEDLKELEKLIAESGKQFFYAENFIYAPAVQKAKLILEKRKSKILFLKGETSLKGSTSLAAGTWKKTGGGTLIRCGTHPLTGILYLKQWESRCRGEVFGIRSVLADTGRATECLSEWEHRYIHARPDDVEDFANVTVTFLDGTKAVVLSTDTVLGGMKDYVEVYCNDTVMHCKIGPTDLMNLYLADERGMEEEPLAMMLSTKLGWTQPEILKESIYGYAEEMQDFLLAAAEGRPAESGIGLAKLATQVLYAAYQSAEEGRRIDFV